MAIIIHRFLISDGGDIAEVMLGENLLVPCAEHNANTKNWTPVATKTSSAHFSIIVDRIGPGNSEKGDTGSVKRGDSIEGPADGLVSTPRSVGEGNSLDCGRTKDAGPTFMESGSDGVVEDRRATKQDQCHIVNGFSEEAYHHPPASPSSPASLPLPASPPSASPSPPDSLPPPPPPSLPDLEDLEDRGLLLLPSNVSRAAVSDVGSLRSTGKKTPVVSFTNENNDIGFVGSDPFNYNDGEIYAIEVTKGDSVAKPSFSASDKTGIGAKSSNSFNFDTESSNRNCFTFETFDATEPLTPTPMNTNFFHETHSNSFPYDTPTNNAIADNTSCLETTSLVVEPSSCTSFDITGFNSLASTSTFDEINDFSFSVREIPMTPKRVMSSTALLMTAAKNLVMKGRRNDGTAKDGVVVQAGRDDSPTKNGGVVQAERDDFHAMNGVVVPVERDDSSAIHGVVLKARSDVVVDVERTDLRAKISVLFPDERTSASDSAFSREFDSGILSIENSDLEKSSASPADSFSHLVPPAVQFLTNNATASSGYLTLPDIATLSPTTLSHERMLKENMDKKIDELTEKLFDDMNNNNVTNVTLSLGKESRVLGVGIGGRSDQGDVSALSESNTVAIEAMVASANHLPADPVDNQTYSVVTEATSHQTKTSINHCSKPKSNYPGKSNESQNHSNLQYCSNNNSTNQSLSLLGPQCQISDVLFPSCNTTVQHPSFNATPQLPGPIMTHHDGDASENHHSTPVVTSSSCVSVTSLPRPTPTASPPCLKRPTPTASPTSDEGIIEDDVTSFSSDINCSFEDGILWSPIVLHPKPPSSNKGKRRLASRVHAGLTWRRCLQRVVRVRPDSSKH